MGCSRKFSRIRKNTATAAITAVATGISARFLRWFVAIINAPIPVRINAHSSRLPAWPPHNAPIL